jgi:hypothetical protein
VLGFLDKDYLASVDQAKGRFRSFMLATLKHFLANDRPADDAATPFGRRVRPDAPTPK